MSGIVLEDAVREAESLTINRSAYLITVSLTHADILTVFRSMCGIREKH